MVQEQYVLRGIRSDVAYAKTGLASLLEDWQKKVTRYKGDISRAKETIIETEQRILILPQLIEDKKSEYKSKFSEAQTHEIQAERMDKKRTGHEQNILGTVLAGGAIGVGMLVAAPTFGVSLALTAPMAAGASAFAWNQYQNAEDCRKAAKTLYQKAFEVQKEGQCLLEENIRKEDELRRANDQIKEKLEMIKALEKEILQLRNVCKSIENIYVKVYNADEHLKTNV